MFYGQMIMIMLKTVGPWLGVYMPALVYLNRMRLRYFVLTRRITFLFTKTIHIHTHSDIPLYYVLNTITWIDKKIDR